MTVTLRPAEPGDEDFLREVYAGTRADEMALVDWTAEQKAAFLAQQFSAQSRDYAANYPEATVDIIVLDGSPAGRLIVDRRPDEVRVVDISLLPEFRGRGAGGWLLRRLLAEAADSGRTVTIHVERFNPAQRLYARLGFVPAGEAGPVYQRMTWTPETAGRGADRGGRPVRGAS